MRGNTVLRDGRNGREVTVELGVFGSMIQLGGSCEPFERTSDDGRARMTGGSEGVRVKRHGGAGTDA